MATDVPDMHDYDAVTRSLTCLAPDTLETGVKAIYRRREVLLARSVGQLLFVVRFARLVAEGLHQRLTVSLVGYGHVASRAAGVLLGVVDAKDLCAVGPRSAQAPAMARLGVRTSDALPDGGPASVVVLACQPVHTLEVARQLRDKVPGSALLISLAAATPLPKLRSLFDHPSPLVLAQSQVPRDPSDEIDEFGVEQLCAPSLLARELAAVRVALSGGGSPPGGPAPAPWGSAAAPPAPSAAAAGQLQARADGLRDGFERLAVFALQRTTTEWAHHVAEAMVASASARSTDQDHALAVCIRAFSDLVGSEARAATPAAPDGAGARSDAGSPAHAATLEGQLKSARRWAAWHREPRPPSREAADRVPSEPRRGQPGLPARVQARARSLALLMLGSGWHPPTGSRKGLRERDEAVSGLAEDWIPRAALALAEDAISRIRRSDA